jgi:hypothetical protein
MHQYTTHNRDYKTFDQFRAAILTFLNQTIPRKWDHFTRKSKSTTVPQLSHAITNHGCFAVIAAAILGQNHAEPLAESRALKRRGCALVRPEAVNASISRPTR